MGHASPVGAVGAVTSTGARGPGDMRELLPFHVGGNYHHWVLPGLKTSAQLETRLSVHSPSPPQSFPNSSTNWGPSIQTCAYGGHSHSNHSIIYTLDYSFLLCMSVNMCTDMWIHVDLRTCMLVYVHTYVHVRVCVHIEARQCVSLNCFLTLTLNLIDFSYIAEPASSRDSALPESPSHSSCTSSGPALR